MPRAYDAVARAGRPARCCRGTTSVRARVNAARTRRALGGHVWSGLIRQCGWPGPAACGLWSDG